MLPEHLLHKSPETPKDPQELVSFLTQLVKLEDMQSLSSADKLSKEEHQKMYEEEYLTEVDDEKFQLIYGAASILKDSILNDISDPNPHNWPMGYYASARALIRLSDIIDYGAEGDFLAESVLAIARAVIKYYESNPKPKVNQDLVILESTSGLINEFYEERKDSAEAIDCVAMIDMLTAVKKQAIQFALEPIQGEDEIAKARQEIQDLYEDAMEDAEAAREFRLDNMSPDDISLGGIELLQGTWLKISSNYANWLYRVGLKHEALELTERILSVQVDSPVALDIQVNCMLDLEEDYTEAGLQLAEKQLEGLLIQQPRELKYLYTIGRLKIKSGDYAESAQVIQRLQIADPEDSKGYIAELLKELERGSEEEADSTPALH